MILGVLALARADSLDSDSAFGVRALDEETLKGPYNFYNGYLAKTSENRVRVVVEIPTGTNAKWEISKADGLLHWERKDGERRVVDYLGYPGNYGSVPRTLLSKDLGGDGDPLDVIILGPPYPRGSIVEAKVIGVLKMTDGGEKDHKLIGLSRNSPFQEVNNLADLEEKYPGVKRILETWFENYKGPGTIKSEGFADAKEAQELLNAAIEAFDKSQTFP